LSKMSVRMFGRDELLVDGCKVSELSKLVVQELSLSGSLCCS
jgi:hypothetical protein